MLFDKKNKVKNLFISVNNDASPSVYICDDTGIHYPCPKCGKQYDDKMDALMCCLQN